MICDTMIKHMDIQLLSKDSLRLKIKKTSLIVDPEASMPKTEADAIISIGNLTGESRINDYRVLIDGVGEYEVGGIKISSFGEDDNLLFTFHLEGNEAILGKASALSKISSDKIKDYSIAIINVDAQIPQNIITAMEPRAIVLYGDNAKDAAKELGKDDVKAAPKVSVIEDKLPEETEVYLLS